MTAVMFQRDDDDEPEVIEQIAYVNVRKSNRGTWEAIPQQYTVDEMATEEQLYEQLGPGTYELIGRDERNARILRRVRVTLGVKPGDTRHAEPAIAQQPVAQAVSGEGLGGSDRMFMAMMQMQQQQTQLIVQMTSQQTQALMTMVTAMMQTTNTNADKQTQQMGAMFAQFGQAQTALFQSFLAQAGSGSPQNQFLEGVKTAIELQNGIRDEKTAGGEGESVAEVMNAVANGAKAFLDVKAAVGGEPNAA